MPRFLTLTAVLLALLITPMLAGCGNKHLAKLRRNPSPEFFTRDQTFQQTLNEDAIVRNQDWRSANEDLRRLFLITRPSRLNPAPNPW